MIRYIFYTIVFVFFTTTAYSQEFASFYNKHKNNWLVNANFGSNLFYGDLRVYDYYPVKENNNERKWAGGIVIGKDIMPYLSGNIQFLTGKLSGTKRVYSNNVPANKYFIASMNEINLHAKFKLLTFLKPDSTHNFDVQFIAGIGLNSFRSALYHLQTDAYLAGYGYGNDDNTKTKKEKTLVIPVGIGFSYNIKPNISLGLNITARKTFTDVLDATAGIATEKKDLYGYTSLSITYKFNLPKIQPKEELPSIKPKLKVNVNKPYNYKATVLSEIPQGISRNRDFIMQLTINKGSITGEAAIVQTYPKGFVPQDPALDNAMFKFDDNQVFIEWSELPKDSIFTVSYLVKIDSVESGEHKIIGVFEYNMNKITTFRNSLFLKFKEEIAKNTDTTINAANNETPKDTLNEQKNNELIDKDDVVFEEKDTEKKTVEYRVQIRASYGKPLSKEKLAKKYNLNEPIYEDIHKGWYKYTVGKFKTHQEAQKYRNKLVEENNVIGAFVVAFSNGLRLNSLTELLTRRIENKYQVQVADSLGVHNINYQSGLYYSVQILASKKRSTEFIKKKLQIEGQPVVEKKYYRWYKYTIGNYNTYNEARKMRDNIRTKKYKDAFVVAYENGNRIPVKVALEKEK